MSSQPWIAWYPADYRAKTSHLTFEQSEAYRRLLEAYYESRGKLKNDRPSLYRICRAMTDSEKEAVDRAAIEFFTPENGSLHHQRADEELAVREQHHARLSEAGHRGGLIAGKGRPKLVRIGQAQARSQSQSQSVPQSKSQESKPLASSDQEPSLSAVALIPLADKSEWPASKEYVKELETAYPQVDGAATLLEIRAWCLSNPTRCKTKRGVMRFINRWFEKEQNHG